MDAAANTYQNSASVDQGDATRQHSIRTFLVWLVLACLLPGIIGAAALFAYEYRESRAQLQKDTIQTARALVQAVDHRILQLQSFAQGLAASDALARGDLAHFHGQAQSAVKNAHPGGTVVLADRGGRQLMNTAEAFGRPLPNHGDPEIVQRVFENSQPVISNVFRGAVLQRPLAAVAVPVMLNGRVAYVLTVSMRVESFDEILKAQGFPAGWVATVLDGNATIVSRSREAERFAGEKPSEAILRRFLSSDEGILEAVMRDGVSVMSAYTRSPNSNWLVAISIPQDELTAQIIRRFSLLALGIALLFGVGLVLARLMARRIAHSFQALMRPAFALGSGERVTFPEVEIKEATELASAMGFASELLKERTETLQETNRRLLEKERELEEAHTLAKFGTWLWNLDTGEITGSHSLRQIFGRAVPPFQEQRGSFLTIDSWERVNTASRMAAQSGGFDMELQANHANGTTIWVYIKCVPLRDAAGRVVSLRGTLQDITERKLAEQYFREAALHDPLTGLPNRALVFENGGRLLAGAQRNHNRGALLFIDLDRFKPINDLYGHETGDRVLEEVAARLKRCTRQEDLVGRLGGDEFVIMLSNVDVGHHRAGVVAQHVVDIISEPFLIGSLELSISPSIGIAYFPDHANNVDGLIHAADLAMYKAKQSGKANYQFYTAELEHRADAAYSVEMRLKNALKHGGFTLHYQPVMDIASGRLIGAEALVRLTDGAGAPVGPDHFIPIAESTGLIADLGEWVAMEACRQHEAWLREGLEISIAINVSPLQFRQRDFAERLGNIVAASGVDPKCLQLEVTESTVMESLDEAIKILDRIKALGMQVALDDFGTGYSSLSSLSCLPLDKLKVDQSFIRRIESDQASRAVTEAIIALGRSLKLDVVGEGIESERALRYLQDQGCNHAQGFWFSRPLPADEFVQWYREQETL